MCVSLCKEPALIIQHPLFQLIENGTIAMHCLLWADMLNQNFKYVYYNWIY